MSLFLNRYRKEKTHMFGGRLPASEKLQGVAGTAAGIGFVLGILVPAGAVFTLQWRCPFGEGILQIGGFLVLTGLGGAIVLGNLSALVLIAAAKYRRRLSDLLKKGR